MGSDQIVFGMLSLRLFPGSPNMLYNLLFPHIKSITLTQNMLGVLIGQLPYNLCVAKAGQMIRKIHSRADILDKQTMIELFIVSIIFMLPVFMKTSKNKAEKSSRNLGSAEISDSNAEAVNSNDSSTDASSVGSLPTDSEDSLDEDEESQYLISQRTTFEFKRFSNWILIHYKAQPDTSYDINLIGTSVPS